MIINSVSPCTEYLTFGPWIYLVPQIKPESVLMLGYAGGTAAGLMRKLYGDDFPIVAVDLEPPEGDPAEHGVAFHQMDARQFVKGAGRYEVIIVDLWEYEPPDFIFSPEFVEDVTSRCDYLIVHCMDYSDMRAYEHLRCVRKLGLDYGARFHYYTVNRVARLPLR